MIFSWMNIFVVQLIVWSIVLFERKNFNHISKADKITFATLLVVSTLLSLFNLVYTPGPIELLKVLFGGFGRWM